MFNFSNYSKDSKFYDDANKKDIGKMKDEHGGVIIDQFIGLKSKMHSIKKIECSESSTAKGVNLATEFNEFKDVLFNKKIIRHKMKGIQAKKHKIGTYEIDKILLSCSDDKRFVLDDGVHILAYFHKDGNDEKIFVIAEKICNNKEKLVAIKKIVIIMTMIIMIMIMTMAMIMINDNDNDNKNENENENENKNETKEYRN